MLRAHWRRLRHWNFFGAIKTKNWCYCQQLPSIRFSRKPHIFVHISKMLQNCWRPELRPRHQWGSAQPSTYPLVAQAREKAQWGSEGGEGWKGGGEEQKLDGLQLLPLGRMTPHTVETRQVVLPSCRDCRRAEVHCVPVKSRPPLSELQQDAAYTAVAVVSRWRCGERATASCVWTTISEWGSVRSLTGWRTWKPRYT